MATATDTLGVGIIGTGRVSGAHARAAQTVPGARLVAASELDEARGQEFAAKWGCAVVRDYHDLLARDDVQIVALCLPHFLHCPVAIDAAYAGKHVLVEKPMADSVEECDRMIEAAHKNHVKLFTAHTENFVPPNVKARALIKSGEVGQPVLATDTWYKPFLFPTRPEWFKDRGKGGGMWLMNGAHMIDRVMYMLDSHVVAVKAFVGTRYHAIKADDMALAYLEMANGVPCSLAHTGYKDQPGAGIAQSGGVIEISCTEAMLKVTNRRQLFRTVPAEQGSQYEEVPVERADTTTIELQRFVDCIRNDTPEPVTVQWARNVVAAMTACEESTRTGREVVIAG